MQEDKPPLKHGDIHPAHVLIEEYGFTSETAPKIEVVAEDVPKNFHELIPLVEKWAISCDARRGDFYDKQPKEEIAEFYKTVEPFVDSINDWLDEQDDDVSKWSEAAVHFMYFLKSHCEAYFSR